MKLYTEEQVRGLVMALCDYNILKEEVVMRELIPIELPSDEEIKSYSDRYSTMHEDVSDKLGKYLVSAIHIDGAEWMKKQIYNQNNQTYDGVRIKKFIKDEGEQILNQNK